MRLKQTRRGRMFKRLKTRYVEVLMLHTSLGSGVWHLVDVVYVLTGKVIG